jgi:DNA modification methylase
VLQALKARGHGRRVGHATWVIQGDRHQPRQAVLVLAGGTLAELELRVAEATDLLRTLDEPADLIIADPPYGLRRDGDETVNPARRVYQRDHDKVIPGYVDVDPDAYTEFAARLLSAAAAAVRPHGNVVIVTGPQRAAHVQIAGENAGLTWVASLACRRAFALRTTRQPSCAHWVATCMTRGPRDHPKRTFNVPPDLPKAANGTDYPLDWWPDNGRADRTGDQLRYDNSLPGKLARRLISAWSDPGELVIDPTVGGGAFADAALALGRRFVGGDLNPHAIRYVAARLLVEHAWPREQAPTLFDAA